MVSEKKKESLKKLKAEMKKYPVIGIIDMHNLPAKQLFEIKQKLKGKAIITMYKKRIIKLALKDSDLKDIKELDSFVQGEPAIIFSNENPFKLANIIQKSRSKRIAKEGDTAPEDIVLREGPTSLPAGPAIGDLQRAKIPAIIAEGKIAIKKDTTVAEKGEAINKIIADILAKLGIEPIEIGLNMLAAWENGLVYTKDVLFIPTEQYIEDLKNAARDAFNLTIGINYYTPQNIQLLLGKAYKEAVSLAVHANISTKETIEPMLLKAYQEAMALKNKTGG